MCRKFQDSSVLKTCRRPAILLPTLLICAVYFHDKKKIEKMAKEEEVKKSFNLLVKSKLFKILSHVFRSFSE